MKELIIEVRDFLKADFNIYAYLMEIDAIWQYYHNLQ
jgi:hypothetical protein